MDMTLKDISVLLMSLTLVVMLISIILIVKDIRYKKKVTFSTMLLCLAIACVEFSIKNYITGLIWTFNTIIWCFNYKRI